MEVCKEALGEVEGELRVEIVKGDSRKGFSYQRVPGKV
jgi:hypothetical protein